MIEGFITIEDVIEEIIQEEIEDEADNDFERFKTQMTRCDTLLSCPF